MKAIILAGGKGERLRPLTDITPKPLLKIKGTPILEHAINNLNKYNITNIILSIGYKADVIKDHFKEKVSYCIEDSPLGTGGAIREAAKGINETFIAINGDNLADFNWEEMIAQHKETKAKITIALTPVDNPSEFGIAELDDKKIINFIEKPKHPKSNLINAGAYVIEPDALDSLPDGKCSIERDCFEKLVEEGVIYGYKHDGQWLATDNLERYNNAEKKWQPN